MRESIISKKTFANLVSVSSCLNIHPILESEPDVLLLVHRGIVHKAVPVNLIKFFERAVHLLQTGNKFSDFFRFAGHSVIDWSVTSPYKTRANHPLDGWL